MAHKSAILTVQKWGNSLALRIPAAIARSVDFHLGTSVELNVQDGDILIKQIGRRKLTLNERLASFDPKKHGGEVMAVTPIGLESFDAHRKKWIPDRNEIIWIDFNPQRGREMSDMHPMLVLSPREFNRITGIVIGLPMTTAKYNDSNPFAVKFQGEGDEVSYVLAHQPKSFDWRQRGAKLHKWQHAPIETLSEACEILNQIMKLTD